VEHPAGSAGFAGSAFEGSVLLTPGAGSTREQQTLAAIDALMPGRVTRIDFPYRLAGKKLPDKAPVLIQAIVDAANGLGAQNQLVLGGRSMGGRMCSMAVAEGLVRATALVLICYPLHPPKKPDRKRTEHFANITVPCLFVSGTKDAFGSPDELLEATALIAGPVTHVWIERADHSLKGHDQFIAEKVVEWLGR
jgi:uncharacterized protein